MRGACAAADVRGAESRSARRRSTAPGTARGAACRAPGPAGSEGAARGLSRPRRRSPRPARGRRLAHRPARTPMPVSLPPIVAADDRAGSVATAVEEATQHAAALLGAYSGYHVDTVVEALVACDVHQ